MISVETLSLWCSNSVVTLFSVIFLEFEVMYLDLSLELERDT